MRIGIDIDDTMTETSDYLRPYVAEFFNLDINYLEDNNISYSNLPEELRSRSLEFAKTYYDKVIVDTPFKPEVSEYIDKIRELGHEIIVITARDKNMYTDEYKTTSQELEKHNIHYDKLICDFDKATICKEEKIDLFIDDSIPNCTRVNEVGVEVLVFNSNINKHIKTNLHRVYNWKEVYDIVKDK